MTVLLFPVALLVSVALVSLAPILVSVAWVGLVFPAVMVYLRHRDRRPGDGLDELDYWTFRPR